MVEMKLLSAHIPGDTEYGHQLLRSIISFRDFFLGFEKITSLNSPSSNLGSSSERDPESFFLVGDSEKEAFP